MEILSTIKHSGGGYWFIVTLMWCKLLFFFIYSKISNKFHIKPVLILLALLILMPILNVASLSVLPWSLDNLKFGIIFYYAGFLSRRFNLFSYLKNKLCIISLMLLVFSSILNSDPVLMYKNLYGNYMLFYIGSFSGIIFICYISIWLENLTHSNILYYFGDTLWLYLMQFYVLDIVISVVIRLPINEYIGSLIVFCITTVVLLPINELMKKYISPFIYR